MPSDISIKLASSGVGADLDTMLVWRSSLVEAVEILRRLAGTTEDEFLQIGSELQGFYQRSSEISGMSNRLVEVVSGDTVRELTDRLQQMLSDMGQYLANARTRSNSSCEILEQVQMMLGRLSTPLEGFQKMNKTLRMLSISTKIESSRLGELGSGFVNLAMDVEKLSHQVNDKSAAILNHRQMLEKMILSNLSEVKSSEASQDRQVSASLNSTEGSLQELLAVNQRCSRFGSTISGISGEVSANISEVVSSMQMHDMTRQQVEHIVEALERLLGDLPDSAATVSDESRCRTLIVEAGDVCELQEAQLRFASSELYSAVGVIVDNLRDVASKQSIMANEILSVTGVADSSGTSFVDDMNRSLNAVTDVLVSCAQSDHNMSETLRKVARTIAEIAVFVTDIEEIGTEIDLIALNAQIKAAHTGTEGAALGVLAEAIKRLSDEAVRQTDSVAETLNGINAATEHLMHDSGSEEEQLVARISGLQDELRGILNDLGSMNLELHSVLSSLIDQVTGLTEDVEKTTSGIDVHERSKAMAAGVLADLEQVVSQARLIIPASNEFKQNLLHMEQRYTMESERHIHEAIARKRGGGSGIAIQSTAKSNVENESEFGDNVDLF